MSKLKISKGFRKFLRKEKAQIRRQILDFSEQEKQIKNLYPVPQNTIGEGQTTNK